MLSGPPMCCRALAEACSIVFAMKGQGVGIDGMWAPVQTVSLNAAAATQVHLS